MRFVDWFFEIGEFDNPFYQGQWKFLHILTLVICAVLIVTFALLYKYLKNKEKYRKILIITLVSIIAFFEIVIRIVYCVRKYHYNMPDMESHSLFWIIVPKPWCAIACWALIASVFVNKKFFYNYASLSALLCSVVFFSYPGVGFNNEYIMFSNLYSIVTHALLLVTSITLITCKFTDFKYKEFYKLAICFVVTFIYGLLEIYVFKTERDPMYFMPGGDIQQGILGIPWGLYITLYILLFAVYVNAFYLVDDKMTVKKLFKKHK